MITPVMTQVSNTPRVAKVIPGTKTDLISLILVSMPPVKRMIHIATVLSASAVSIPISMRSALKNAPKKCEPKNIPTTRKSNNAGTPYR